MKKGILVFFLIGACAYSGPIFYRIRQGNLYGERCVDVDKNLVDAARKAVVDSCMKTGLCTRKPTGKPWLCVTECKTTCGGRLGKVHGCAGSNAIYVAIGPWSFKQLLVHEMIKNLVVSRFTIIPYDSSDRYVSLHPKFAATEWEANQLLRSYHDYAKACGE